MTSTRRRTRRAVIWAGSVAIAASIASTSAADNDYPTEARVDYVLACMASNGQDYLTMQRCSCSIDTIAELIPYKEYEQVETIIRMRERQGELGVVFRSSPALEDKVQALKDAQIEADLRCF